jgi:hypothetical protein
MKETSKNVFAKETRNKLRNYILSSPVAFLVHCAAYWLISYYFPVHCLKKEKLHNEIDHM